MIDILYEDNHVLVVIKPSGILSQADSTHDMDMITLLKNYLKEKYHKPGNVYLGLVHRLDRMTGGVMVFAKTSKCASRLSQQIRNHQFIKKYYALVKGSTPTRGTLEDYLIKDEKDVQSYVTTEEFGKLARLEYVKIKEVLGNTLVSVLLHTGRHHQIRVQFAHFGHPLIGDSLYGSKSNDNLMLYAYHLSFAHPVTKERMSFEVLPQEKNWKSYFS